MNEVAIIYPEKPSATIRRAIDFLSSHIAEFTIDFPLCVSEAEVIPEGVRVPIYIGTKENSKNVFELSDVSLDIAEQYYKIPLYSANVTSVARTDRFTGYVVSASQTAFSLESLQHLEFVGG